MNRGRLLGLTLFIGLAGISAHGHAPVADAAAEPEVILRHGLALPCVGSIGRRPLVVNPVLASWASSVNWPPRPGDKVFVPENRSVAWEEIDAKPDGVFDTARLRSGFLYFTVHRPRAGVMMLQASGHQCVLVNDEPREGDTPGRQEEEIPIALHAGENRLLFLLAPCGKEFQAKLIPPRGQVFLSGEDHALGYGTLGQPYRSLGAIPVVNATTQTQTGLVLTAKTRTGNILTTALPPLPPLTIRKAAFEVAAPAPNRLGSLAVEVTLRHTDRGMLDRGKLAATVVRPGAARLVTFRSSIDGSVQEYAYLPPAPLTGPQREPPGLLITLHGAGTDALKHLSHYHAKTWCHIVAPTNRRPYGFDWEDWGRLDAMEVLHQILPALDCDPRRVWLTGHSMGGHGTWHLGATYPDRFAALAPCAAWISMFTYAGMKQEHSPTPLQEILQRGATPSDTLALAANLHMPAIYVSHGCKDANVPVNQARKMRDVLSKSHSRFHYEERRGEGHWSGARCIDCPRLMTYLAQSRLPLPSDVNQLQFTTASPGVASTCHWAAIEAQHKPWQLSSVSLQRDKQNALIRGSTANVSRLSLNLDGMPTGRPVRVHLDGQALPPIAFTTAQRIWLENDGRAWHIGSKPVPALKGPHRYGGFKDAFRHRMLFIYGTQGTTEENAWALAQARYLAEVFWQRGNGAVDILPDNQFDPEIDPDRNVILLGNADTNGAWRPLLAHCPVQFRRGEVQCGDKLWEGEDLGGLFLSPRPGSDIACVGVIGGSGLPGMRSVSLQPLFISGTPYPDCLIVDGPQMLMEGLPGVRCAGFFGVDWQVKTGEFVMP